MATLQSEIWINQLMEKFYPETSFLNYTRNFSALVNNNKIHLADAGIDPTVLINNTAYPIAVVNRTDAPIEIELDKFETENTIVRYPDVVEYSYDQMESVIYGHRMTLTTKTAAKAAHSITPQQDGIDTPVIECTGDVRTNGYKRISFDDILNLKERFDDIDVPNDQRVLVLNPKHSADLMSSDMKLFKDLLEYKDGKPSKIAGFMVVEFTKNPVFDATTNTKKAFGALTALDDAYSSFAFYGQEVMRADGDLKMYIHQDDPRERATIIGFDKRFVCLPIRNKAIGAIISKKQ